jgi:hypothetical protein
MFLREQSPEGRMVPAQLVFGAVAMGAHTVPELLHFRDQFLA